MFTEHANEVAHVVESAMIANFCHRVIGVGKHLAGMTYAQSVNIVDICAVGFVLEKV